MNRQKSCTRSFKASLRKVSFVPRLLARMSLKKGLGYRRTLCGGSEASPRSPLSELLILELNMATINVASVLYLDLVRKGKMVGEFDILIASTCIQTGHALVTNDGDFDIFTKLSKLHY